jgi:hypothetical protein
MRDLDVSHHLYVRGFDDGGTLATRFSSCFGKPSFPVRKIGDVSELPCGRLLSITEISQFSSSGVDQEPSFRTDNDSGRNLVVLNIGAHIHGIEDFNRNMKELIGWIDEWRRPSDIIFYRSSVPGCKHSTPESTAEEDQLD